jgi:hypothetical protein
MDNLTFQISKKYLSTILILNPMTWFYFRKLLLTHRHYDSPRNILLTIRPSSSLVLIVKLWLDSTVIGCPLLERIVEASRASSTIAWPLSWMPPVTIRSCPMPSCNTPYTGWVPCCLAFLPVNIIWWPPLWSRGQSYFLQIRRPRFDSRHYQNKK